ncbi:MAG TPA: cysteine--tRNA ligase [Sandaracinaceae bacterium LLY-WYZ-13_1]|nr:cysteine--tRNA ligase [Sandaracinaceae bacterium LLY-WYZ-13_1]
MPAPFRLYNTLSREVEDFAPQQEGEVKLYVCGMTVYDHSHVGHARAMVTFDMVTRYLRHRGWDVVFVRNYTDVDDKIIARAEETGEEPLALAQRYIDSFEEDMRELGLSSPTHEPRVSECIDDILGLIQKLVDQDYAYPNEGSVWFDVAKFPGYGKLSGQRVDEVRSAETMPGKRSPQDFALWKAAKPGEPQWDSPWGPGRPGWHIECSAMAYKHLGEELDIHGGGLDLVFPHHENEIAQSECAHGHHPYARYWMHNGMLTMAGGQKMGKSLGNVFGIAEALKLFPAEALRIYYLQVHYRSPLPWSLDALPDALALLARLYEAREVAGQMRGEEDPKVVAEQLGKDAIRVLELSESFEARLHAAMDDDFNTAKALGYAFELARAVNRLANHKKARKRGGPIAKKAIAAFDVVSEALGLLAMDPAAFVDEVKDKRLPALGLTRGQVEAKLEARSEARQAKDWAKADALRDELEGAGIQVMDRPDGVEWRIRLDVREDAEA